MNVFKRLLPQICLERMQEMSAIRLLTALTLFLGILCLPACSFPTKKAIGHNHFADWCFDRANLPSETRHTVDVLLQQAKTQDCDRAESMLLAFTLLYLISNQIADLKPLSSLTRLKELNLYNNQVADLKPLSSLTNLIHLFLIRNQIADLKPLSSLTKLRVLDLDHNRITDLKPLSPLTHRTELDLRDNRITDLKPLSSLTHLTGPNLRDNPLTAKTCPVKPESICHF